MPKSPPASQSARLPIDRLMTAIIQVQDLNDVNRALAKLNVPVLPISSSGGFLGSQSVTLIIGIPGRLEEAIIAILTQTCHRRVHYVASPLEGSPVPILPTTPVTIGGATIFTYNVERFEEF